MEVSLYGSFWLGSCCLVLVGLLLLALPLCFFYAGFTGGSCMWFFCRRVRIRCPSFGCRRFLVTSVSSSPVVIGLVLCLPSSIAGSVALVLLFVSLVLLSLVPYPAFVSRCGPLHRLPDLSSALGSRVVMCIPCSVVMSCFFVRRFACLLTLLPCVSSVPVLLWCSMYVSVYVSCSYVHVRRLSLASLSHVWYPLLMFYLSSSSPCLLSCSCYCIMVLRVCRSVATFASLPALLLLSLLLLSSCCCCRCCCSPCLALLASFAVVLLGSVSVSLLVLSGMSVVGESGIVCQWCSVGWSRCFCFSSCLLVLLLVCQHVSGILLRSMSVLGVSVVVSFCLSYCLLLSLLLVSVLVSYRVEDLLVCCCCLSRCLVALRSLSSMGVCVSY